MVEVGSPSGRQLQDDSTRTYDFVTLQDSDFVEWINGGHRSGCGWSKLSPTFESITCRNFSILKPFNNCIGV
ncbi:9002_t:CDS:2, partial [Rhizophagus irregularis]